jgi:hypothetical protein
MPAFPLARGSGRLAGVLHAQPGTPAGGVPPAVLQDSSTYLHVPQKLTGLISLYTNPVRRFEVSLFKPPLKALNPP